MHAYVHFAKFYDATMGNRAGSAKFVHDLIRKHAPRTRTLLELACGTGAVLQHLAPHFEVEGLDISPQMLRIARARLPEVRLHRADMTAFDLVRTFDAIICVYDSINHLLSLRAWRRVFSCAARHLATGGLFIFDINTEGKLHRMNGEPAWIKTLDSGPLIMKVTDAGRSISNWNIRVFEHRGGKRYRLHEENIPQISFPVDRVIKVLRPHFSDVGLVDPVRRRPSSKSDRLYFICDHR